MLDGESKKLLQAFYVDALPEDLLKSEQERIKDEKARLQSELDQVQADIFTFPKSLQAGAERGEGHDRGLQRSGRH